MESKIKTIEDAFVATGRNPKALPDVSILPEQDGKFIINNYNLSVVVEAINKESNEDKPWFPNWNDHSERKWEGWFGIKASEEKPSGFGFSGTGCDYTFSYSVVGSRFCFKTKEGLQYAQEQFEDLFLAVIVRLE